MVLLIYLDILRRIKLPIKYTFYFLMLEINTPTNKLSKGNAHR